ncbi:MULTISPECIES: PucR family transcriptional regulator [Brevibacillus]|uniref:Transcriptional regulator n=1 Tax=Brevibacillus borstelensis AK1 TaxID=1300222 RepID=M8DAX2_9BACL|nr:helix-turn-helix domain-containing protein [Brevibacillus borstelensis]EMT50533.1 transcriptional regulator [Brevibacillus borstelensis AK1]KKX57023.1 transcriptional regulator [Brevibacillus borstelensis cifa_chp40]MBE5395268.1 PucR family transcriptional regulator [Brevibacillus borstelensis]MCC0563895.1 helix-turn-helix domain-containing protein [Brevibacillus borstelensis]MCM3469992.1 helix-turn-helix domain-containing protein [Brevibacillus borstelensis]
MSNQPNVFQQFQHADIDELADVIGELLQNPITIEDADHKLIAYSSHSESTDQARWSTIMGRRVPEKVLTRLWKDGVFQELLTKDEPVHIPAKDEVGLGKRVAIAIRKGSEVLGYIWAIEVNRPITEEDDDILRQAARAAVSRLVQRQGKRKAEEQRRKEFLWELLLGNHSSDTLIRQKAESLQLQLSTPYLICIIEAAGTRLEQYLYPLLMRDKLLWVVDGNQIVLLIGQAGAGKQQDEALVRKVKQFLADSLGKLESHVSEGQVTAGYGRSYKAYADLVKSYREALHAVKIKRLFPQETAGIHGYRELGIYRYLLKLKQWDEEQGYENERLARLKQYDAENQTAMTETLETYLDAAGKVNITANRLHIHINTLSYRLKRIEEIMQVDLEDMNQRVALYLELKLDKLNSER